MAEIQTYPQGTPALDDLVPYVADPAGTPALMLSPLAELGGGGATARTFDGSDFTGTTVAGGTWTAGADFAQTDTADTARYLALADEERYSPFHAAIELELQFAAGAGFTGVSTLYEKARNTDSPCVALHENTLYLIRDGAAIDATITVTAPADTWHTLRVVSSGTFWSYYLNGQLVKNAVFGASITANGFGLYSQGTTSHFRNIKLWIR